MGLHDEHNQDHGRDQGHGADALFGGGLPGPGDGDRWSAALRAAADGELTEEQARELSSLDGTADGRVAFERGLRESVARSMGGVSAPAGLRERVLVAARAAGDEALSDALTERSEETRDRSFWNGQGRLLGALAAVLMLAVGGVFVSRMAGIGGGPEAYRTNLARFVSAEHQRSLDEAYAKRKYCYTDVSAAVEETEGQLDAEPDMPPCGEKTRFRGAAPCGVPGKGPSAHFQFVMDAGGESRTVSLFVRRDGGELPIDERRAYRVNTKACNVEGVAIYVWRSEGLMYTFVASGQGGSICNIMLKDLGIAEPEPDDSI
jgi:hypothetical protein